MRPQDASVAPSDDGDIVLVVPLEELFALVKQDDLGVWVVAVEYRFILFSEESVETVVDGTFEGSVVKVGL